jgi:exopolyphosphatase / guanosine-5'-triphosphate,3'-diphosphate pyrophosphatase
VSATPERPADPAARRIAAIDVGTNSIRLTVAEVTPDGRHRILDDEKETTRLGRGLATTGQMTTEAMERSVEALARMRRIAEGYGVVALRAVGTCAIREAANRDEFLALAESRAGVTVEPIVAEAEAQLAHASAANAFDLRALAVAVVDIGGGSTEVIFSSQGVVEQVYPLPLGAVRLTEQFGGPEQAAGENYRALRREVRTVLRRQLGEPPFSPQLLIGTGGTFTSLANILLNRDYPTQVTELFRPSVRGYELKRSEVRHAIDWLREVPARDRARVAGLSAERAEIIVAGLTIVERVMKHLDANRLRVHDGGIRDGLLRTMAQAVYPRSDPAAAAPDRLRAVREFARACTYEERHCGHVARLAGQILDQLARLFPDGAMGWADHESRELLEAAALLHDVGYLINYAKHHRHSYHLIAHSDLAGFTHRETELVANIARYHGGAEPKRNHPHFGKLPKADRKLVRRLAAILRIAEGLDRGHAQNVRGVTIHLERDAAVFLLDAADDPAVDMWAAARNSRLFRRVFKVRPKFEWRAEQAERSPAAVAVAAPGLAETTGGRGT